MKLKRILSSALLAVMIFTTVAAAVPFTVSAAYTGNSEASTLSEEQIIEVAKAVTSYEFASADEMLTYEMDKGYLLPLESGNYVIYVNRYTGALYYCNKVTGQILTSNPYNYSHINSAADRNKVSSQLSVTLSAISTSEKPVLASSEEAAARAQISTDYIDNGIRVNYTLGDTVKRYLLPGRIKASELEEMLLVPMLTEYARLMEEHCSVNKYSDGFDYDLFGSKEYNKESDKDSVQKKNVYYKGTLNLACIKKYVESCNDICNKMYKAGAISADVYGRITTIYGDLMTLYIAAGGYALKNLERAATSSAYDEMIKQFYSDPELAIYENRDPIYVFTGETNTAKSNASKAFKRYVTDYSFDEMFEDEDECGYVDNTAVKPVFRCSIEYRFNDDGSLSVRLPANSISFDETVYNLESITLLEYFGAGNTTKEGYVFFPDGSGTIVDFTDFYNAEKGVSENTAVSAETYGSDYCYSKVTGAHREQVSMPVFGIVTTEKSSTLTNATYGVETVTNGFFAILEEGASLARIVFRTGVNQLGSVYCQYSPYPSDEYDISDTISVGGTGSYTIVSDSKFNGSYVTRYVMLTDEALSSGVSGKYYPTNYVGMASYYRDYLYNNGTLKALTNIKENLPLYIEALGSMEIITKVLSFPVTKNIPLTEFENIVTMYEELYNSASVFEEEANRYQALADAEADATKKAEYQAIADGYKEFVIDNINFRLTGFTKNGLSGAYPTKLRWEKACGGKREFKKLLEYSKEVADDGANMGIYPDFDFMYLSNSSMFDGVSKRQNVSKMIDGRYASQQVYDAITSQYISYFTLVISPESLDELYSKFSKKYSKYDITSISLSTMGSDLNSNFDEDVPVNRDDAENYVTAVLNRIANEDELDIMLDKGNAYTLKYASHILNASIDSSHFKHSSYAIPFVGMILHGSVNYTGTPINYAGAPRYELLRAIESGASLYYILCYQNTSFMKEDLILSDYYGVNYSSWYENIVRTYKELNDVTSDLQDYLITDHKIIIGERVRDDKELDENYKTLMLEMAELLEASIKSAVAAGYSELQATADPGAKNLVLDVDTASLMSEFAGILNLTLDEAKAYKVDGDVTFEALINELVAKYEAEYASVTGVDNYVVSLASSGANVTADFEVEFEYESKYSFFTDSIATDKNYVYTDYTNDIGNIALVTYQKTLADGTVDTVQFILNYNIYSVTVDLGGGNKYTLGKYEYVRIG
ncbi:MAG: hypothetical protein IJY23_07925 [Clostridia bacterium]|nr:hypothetical protein [Clostridia bacterium]